jgi:hypothetical protein
MFRVHILSALLLAVLFNPALADEPPPEKIDLFKVGDLGYRLFHIPGIVVTARGTVLAWCEARQDGSDWDQIDILLRRSIAERLGGTPLRSSEGRAYASPACRFLAPPAGETR